MDFTSNNIKLFLSDCESVLKNNVQDNSIDCVITDPPYFIDKLDDSWNTADLEKNKSNSHVKHLPRGMKFTKEQSKQFYDYYFKVSKLIYQKLKPGGFFLSFSSPRLYHAMAMAMDDAGFEIRDMINWVYTQSMPKGMSVANQIDRLDLSDQEKEQLKDKYKNHKTPQIKSCFEPICVAMKPIKGTFLNNELQYNTGLIDFGQKVGDDKVPANIVTTDYICDVYDKNFMVKKPTKDEKGDYNTHLSVKPVSLMKHLINLFTKENAVVLDPFLGSGTTMVACVETNRKGMGIEKNKEYYDISVKRISEKN